MEEDKIKISGEDNKIKIEEGEKIEIKGDDNVVKIHDAEEVEIKGDDNVVKIGEKKDIKESFKDIRSGFKGALNFFQQKKVISVVIIVLLLLILIGGTWIRLQNLPLLVDSTTGKYIPLALDPFYFLRVAETMISGDLPLYDNMRYPSLNIEFTTEFLPKAIVGLHSIAKVFDGDISIRFVDVLSPVIFFILGLIAFFFLVYILTKSPIAALISTGFLAIIPSYLYRTLAGFADHESIGMFAFFLAFLGYGLALRFFDKGVEKKDKLLFKSVLFGLIVGFFSAFSMVSWGGGAIFLFMIFPLSFLIFWLIKTQEHKDNSQLKSFIVFYVTWLFSSVLFGLFFSSNLNSLLARFILSSTGLLSLFVLGFIIIDYILINKIEKIKLSKKWPREVYSLIATVISGIVFLTLTGKNFFSMIKGIWHQLLHPFGLGRVGLTIAENAQPYLLDWIGQIGKILFWIFILGLIFIGFEIAKGIKSKKHRYGFFLVWIIMFSGILFSRVSANSLFNGTNFISQAFYLIGLILFVGYAIKLYLKKEIKLKPEIIIIASWMFFMLISGRSATRFFFALTPFVAFMAGFSVVKLFGYLKKSKDELLKTMLFIIFALLIVGLLITSQGFIKSSIQQAKYTGPSANFQWQNAMSWVRDNTPQGSIFVHWWDYGYWVQYLGERPTITDGGHANGFWDHLIGRYLLTTPYPETALSFMKAHNVSYLLIDSTDLGKYPAYSRIGGDENSDRFSSIPVISSDPSQIQETSTGTIRIYQGGLGVDEDIIYNLEGTEIFLPGPTYDEIGNPSFNSFIGGVILETKDMNSQPAINQPKAVFIYNGEQIEVLIQYAYYQGELLDFKNGLNAVFQIIPKISSSGQGVEIDEFGSGIYLSPKVSKSLFAQLYLLEDAFNNYGSLELVHTESSPVVASLKSQGLYLGEFIDYQGFQGPMKIWEIGENPNIIEREEFLRVSGEYAEFDDLIFVK